MQLVPYTNATDQPQHIGNRTINPGQTRMVEQDALPKLAPEFNALDFLARPIKQIEPDLYNLPLSQLEILLDQERIGDKRKGLIDAISNEIIAQEKGVELEQFKASLVEYTADQLSVLLLDLRDDEAKRLIVEDALKSR